MSQFYCREDELRKLNKRYAGDKFECIVIYGRRRVGKTALINEFCKDKPLSLIHISWPLWYLLSAIYGLTILKLLVESKKETKKFNFYSIAIIFFCVFMHFATDYLVNINTTNNVVMTVSLLLEKTIGRGWLFSGVYYILLGNLIAKNEYHIDRIYLLAIFTASYLVAAFTSFFPIKVIMCITFFLLVISFEATGNGIYFRRTSTIMYYTHMIVFFVLNICLLYTSRCV